MQFSFTCNGEALAAIYITPRGLRAKCKKNQTMKTRQNPKKAKSQIKVRTTREYGFTTLNVGSGGACGIGIALERNNNIYL